MFLIIAIVVVVIMAVAYVVTPNYTITKVQWGSKKADYTAKAQSVFDTKTGILKAPLWQTIGDPDPQTPKTALISYRKKWTPRTLTWAENVNTVNSAGNIQLP